MTAAAARKLRGATEAALWRAVTKAERAAALGGSVFPDDTPQKRQERLERYDRDPLYFCQTLLPHYFTGPSADFHEAWLKHLEDFAAPNPEAGAPGAVVQCPRGGAKTTVISFAGLLRLLLLDRVKFAVLVTDVAALSDEVVNAIADELEDNPRIRTDFGELLASRADTKFGANVRLTNGCRLQGLSMRASFRGLKHGPYRPQLAVVDDPESTESVRNPEIRQQRRWKLTNELRKAMQPGGCIFVVQNMIHADCLSGHIVADVTKAAKALELGQPVDEFRFRHWTIFVYAIRKPDGSSAWPSRFPDVVLDAMEAEDPDGFALEMMNLPVARTGRTFTRETFRLYVPEELADLALWRVMSCDPSMGKTDRSDFSAIIVLGTAEDGRSFVEEADLKRRSPLVIVRDLFRHWLAYNPAITLIESVAFQAVLGDLLEALAEEHQLYPAIKQYEDRTPKDLRIKRLERPVNSGVVLFRADQVELLRQLDLYGTSGVHDDGPDALEMAWSEVQRRQRGTVRKGEIRFGGRRRNFGRRSIGSDDLNLWRAAVDWFVALGASLGHVPPQRLEWGVAA